MKSALQMLHYCCLKLTATYSVRIRPTAVELWALAGCSVVLVLKHPSFNLDGDAEFWNLIVWSETITETWWEISLAWIRIQCKRSCSSCCEQFGVFECEPLAPSTCAMCKRASIADHCRCLRSYLRAHYRASRRALPNTPVSQTKPRSADGKARAPPLAQQCLSIQANSLPFFGGLSPLQVIIFH